MCTHQAQEKNMRSDYFRLKKRLQVENLGCAWCVQSKFPMQEKICHRIMIILHIHADPVPGAKKKLRTSLSGG